MCNSNLDIRSLTIGNLLLLRSAAIMEVDELSLKTMTVNGIPINDDILSPIPINYEWLEKFGFIDPAKNGMAIRLSLNSECELCWYTQPGELRLQTIGSGWTRKLPTRYIHQLQNLFWDITRTELKFKTE